MITLSELTFAFSGRPPVLDRVSLEIAGGTYVGIMGANGSGKSTLALLMKGLYLPSGGTVVVDGWNTSANELSRNEAMRRVGVVFQNPENTIVATTVEREIAFGLENLGVPEDEMHARVEDALRRFDLEKYRYSGPGRLAGGEKQRLALAAVMVMRPAHLILDEPTSLLDPEGGERILSLIHATVRQGATVIHITQSAAEALGADRLIVLANGKVARDDIPREALRDAPKAGIEGMEDVRAYFAGFGASLSPTTECGPRRDASTLPTPGLHRDAQVFLERVSFTYEMGTPFSQRALDDVSFDLPRGVATVLLGPSGSGKTTLLEIVSGITLPSSGRVTLRGNPLRAMAFQFPEDQIFGDTVESYTVFGPENVGVSENEREKAVDDALLAVGLDPSEYRGRDPFALSGGEKRRVALAGALAMRPDALILDEPTAGLDRRSTDMVVDSLYYYLLDGGTLLLSTHDFRVARRLARRALVLVHGRVETYGELDSVFASSPWLRMLGERARIRLDISE